MQRSPFFVHRLVEWGLWVVLLLCAYGQRDSWRVGDWWYFGMSSALGGIVAQTLRKHITTEPQP